MTNILIGLVVQQIQEQIPGIFNDVGEFENHGDLHIATVYIDEVYHKLHIFFDLDRFNQTREIFRRTSAFPRFARKVREGQFQVTIPTFNEVEEEVNVERTCYYIVSRPHGTYSNSDSQILDQHFPEAFLLPFFRETLIAEPLREYLENLGQLLSQDIYHRQYLSPRDIFLSDFKFSKVEISLVDAFIPKRWREIQVNPFKNAGSVILAALRPEENPFDGDQLTNITRVDAEAKLQEGTDQLKITEEARDFNLLFPFGDERSPRFHANLVQFAKNYEWLNT